MITRHGRSCFLFTSKLLFLGLFVGFLFFALPFPVHAQEKDPSEPVVMPTPKAEEKAAAAQQEDTKSELDELNSVIEEQKKKIDNKDQLSQAQREEIEALSKKLEILQTQLEDQHKLGEEQRAQIQEMNDLLLSVHNRLQEMQDQVPQTSVSGALDKRLAELESSINDQAELPPDMVTAGDFPGSFKIPGTDAAMKIGGRVKFSMVNNLDALGVDDRFITAEIPIRGTSEAGKGERLTMSARSSRINFDIRTPTGVGHMRAFIEADFAGDGDTFKLRHAYGQYERVLVGQTWSTFADPSAQPEGIDFEGLNSRNLVRQTQIRWTLALDDDKSLAFAFENPQADISGAGDVNQVPDIIIRSRWEKPYGPLGHLQAALIFRQIRGEPDDRPTLTDRELGYGITVSGKLAIPSFHEKDNMVFQINSGNGLGRYLNDLEYEGGQDAAVDTDDDRMKTLPVFGLYTGYQHWWGEQTRSNLLYGFVYVHNRGYQPGDSYHETRRYSLNYIWSPIPRIDIGTELLYGNREDKDGGKGSSVQLQFAVSFRF